MSTPAAAVQAQFGADTGPLAKDAATAEGIVGKFASSTLAALSAVGLTLGAGALMGFFKSVIEKAGSLNDLSGNLQVSTDELQAFDFAARQAGASSEAATAVWEKTKKALDMLAAGQETAVKQFAALGLTAADFQGLNLAESLEKLSSAFAANADRAGSFDAIGDIIGSKTAPKLNAVILQLASEGFPQLVEAAKTAGQVLDEEVIGKLDAFGDKMDELKGRLAPFGADVLAVVLRIGDGLGMMAANVVNFGEGLETYVKRSDFIAEKTIATVNAVLPPLEKTTAQLKEQKELEDSRLKLIEFVQKATLEEAGYAGKVAELRRQMVEHAQAAFAIGISAVDQNKELLKFAQAEEELRKLERKHREEARLSDKQQLEHAVLLAKTKGRLSEDETAGIATITRLIVQQTQNVTGLTEKERMRLAVLALQEDNAKSQRDLKEMLRDGVDKLNDKDLRNVMLLQAQVENNDRQIQQYEAIAGTKDVIVEKTEEQLAAESAISEQIVYQSSLRIKRGREDKDLSDRELAEKIANLKEGLMQSQISDPTGKYAYLDNLTRSQLSNAEWEANRRREFRNAYAREGEKALLGYSAFDEQTLRNYIRPEDEKRAQQQLEETRRTNRLLGRIVGDDV